MNNKLKAAAFAVVAVLLFYLGRLSKSCLEIQSVQVSTDTAESYVPITGGAGSPLTVISHPQNMPTYTSTVQLLPPVIRVSHDTVYVDSTDRLCSRCSHIAVDTLRHDSLYVALKDSVTCEGIASRSYTFGGKQKQLTVTNTVTKTVLVQPPLFQLNAGAQTFYNGKTFTDVGLTAGLEFKHKYSFNYGFMINSKTHSFSLLTKLK